MRIASEIPLVIYLFDAETASYTMKKVRSEISCASPCRRHSRKDPFARA